MANRLKGSYRDATKDPRTRTRGIRAKMRMQKELEAIARNKETLHKNKARHRRGLCSCG